MILDLWGASVVLKKSMSDCRRWIKLNAYLSDKPMCLGGTEIIISPFFYHEALNSPVLTCGPAPSPLGVLRGPSKDIS